MTPPIYRLNEDGFREGGQLHPAGVVVVAIPAVLAAHGALDAAREPNRL
jgi:hypothetical protein